MEIAFVRSSSYSQKDYCQMSFFIQYGLGHTTPTQLKALLGTITHKVMEVLANCKKVVQDSPKKKKFVFNDEELGEFKYDYNSLMSDDFVRRLLDRSYTHYTVNSPHLEFDDKKNYKFCEDMVQAGLTMNDGSYDPRNQNIFQAETKFDLEINEPWATYEYNGQKYTLRIKGTIDLIVKEGDDMLHICDYKTGQRIDWATGKEKTIDKLYEDFQLMLYYYAIGRLFPEYKNKMVTIIFLRDGGPFTLCFDEHTDEKTLGKIKKHLKEVLDLKNPRPINPWRSDFRCTRLCHFYKTKWPESEKSMCHYVEDHVKTYGIDDTAMKLKKGNFSVSYYRAPGQTDDQTK